MNLSQLNSTKALIMRPFRLLSLLGVLALQSACVTSVITPEQETQAGSAMSQQVADQIGLYDDPALERYVDSVGQRLVDALGESPYTFQFSVVDQFEPNAFASPGGFIYISRGLLAQMNSEAELAGVIAHEISHVTRRHHARQVGRSLGTGLLTLPGKAVGVVSQDLGNMINTPIEYAGQVYLSSYSRGQETEADQYGMKLAAAAGYDPLALADALEGIERTVFLLTGEHHEATYMDTHPTTPQRVTDINTLAASLTPATIPPIATRAQLYYNLDGMWWDPQNPQQGVFKGTSFLNADMDFTVTFPSEWETVNTPRFVGATEKEGGAYLALGANSGEFTPEGYAAALITRMRDQARLEPNVNSAFDIGGWPAHVVRYDETADDQVVSLYYVFVAAPGGSYTFMAMGFEEFRETLRKSVMSIRPLSDAERNSIRGLRLRVTAIRPGESLEQWAKRNSSEWGPKFISSMNGLDSEQHIGSGEPLKYVREEKYVAP
jgi:predicted Zn-dependent protease